LLKNHFGHPIKAANHRILGRFHAPDLKMATKRSHPHIFAIKQGRFMRSLASLPHQYRSSMNENRRFSRVPFDAPTYFSLDSVDYEGELIDISLKGVLIQLPVVAPENAIGKVVKISIGECDSPIPINMTAVCVHLDEHLMGFDCQAIDLDSATYLRRLLEVNLGSEDQVNNELTALIQSYNR